MKITDVLVMDGSGEELPADPFGNNLAVSCQVCGHPILLIALDNQRGSDEDHPATCRSCGQKYFLDIRGQSEKIYVHTI